MGSMRILHTEASKGWGGQEIRILREAIELKKRGFEIIFAVAKGAALIERAREQGFLVMEVSFKKPAYPYTLLKLIYLIKKQQIDLVVTHSSSDAWIGGIAARAAGRRVIRMRHLSTKIKKGLNSRLLYNGLADYVVTTSSTIIPIICAQARLSADKISCVPTGVSPETMHCEPKEVEKFRRDLGVSSHDLLIGTVCCLRSWKGIQDLLEVVRLLKDKPHLKWVIVGGGYVDTYKALAKQLGVEDKVVFTGFLENPVVATAALDIFMLLSTAHEGIAQSSLQAAFLEKPLITTSIGGLPEVCLDGITGFIVPPHAPQEVVKSIMRLSDEKLRKEFGRAAKDLVMQQFLFQKTIHDMEKIYRNNFIQTV